MKTNSLSWTPRLIYTKFPMKSKIAKKKSSQNKNGPRTKQTELLSSKFLTKELVEFCSSYLIMKSSLKSMDVYQLARKPMFIMQSTTKPKNSTPSKYTKHLSWSLKTETDMSKESSDSEEATARAIQERWSACGLKNN